jgi:hypothetical protein
MGTARFPLPMPTLRRVRRSRRRATGFVLAALAATLTLTAVPDRPPTAAEAAAARLEHADRLARKELGAAIDQYRLDHGALPGRLVADNLTDRPSAGLLIRQLTRATNERGHVAPAPEPDYPFGPYLSAGLPTNPENGQNSVRFAGAKQAADNTSGWSVDPDSGEVRSNAIGAGAAQ